MSLEISLLVAYRHGVESGLCRRSLVMPDLIFHIIPFGVRKAKAGDGDRLFGAIS